MLLKTPGVDVNAGSNDGQTPLHLTVRVSIISIASMIIKTYFAYLYTLHIQDSPYRVTSNLCWTLHFLVSIEKSLWDMCERDCKFCHFLIFFNLDGNGTDTRMVTSFLREQLNFATFLFAPYRKLR